MNRSNIIGNLASDPEVRGDFIELTVADNPRGEKAKARYKTNFVRATFKAGSVLGTMAAECKKGDKVYIAGETLRREWADKGKSGVSIEMPYVDAFEKCFQNVAGADTAADPFA